ncbi:unnamed protein product [Vitrella brassicaformis CCMP3155]|uniref:SANT and BTB domain-containing protein n=1 Tax=Vitrella brassicaformis (strain CCMP3155) TaxID=1169540 RepID=A0A0G4FM13_VITBC|nr:unnamed protein product [Vitrella brassicaformis CCMP3155]|eukprot:CEM15060.1 unnamed protein product [Vitrella brassicaformis CCMP3155]
MVDRLTCVGKTVAAPNLTQSRKCSVPSSFPPRPTSTQAWDEAEALAEIPHDAHEELLIRGRPAGLRPSTAPLHPPGTRDTGSGGGGGGGSRSRRFSQADRFLQRLCEQSQQELNSGIYAEGGYHRSSTHPDAAARGPPPAAAASASAQSQAGAASPFSRPARPNRPPISPTWPTLQSSPSYHAAHAVSRAARERGTLPYQRPDGVAPLLPPSWRQHPFAGLSSSTSSHATTVRSLAREHEGQDGDKSPPKQQQQQQQENGEETDMLTIHVADDRRGVQKEYRCSRERLLRHMKYFEPYLACGTEVDSRASDVDISVSCDVAIFSWLVHYMDTDGDEADNPLDVTSVVSLLVSAEFLSMEAVVQQCLRFIKTHINQVVKLPLDLGCISSRLLDDLAAMFTDDELERVRDKRDKLASRLWARKVQSLLNGTWPSITVIEQGHRGEGTTGEEGEATEDGEGVESLESVATVASAPSLRRCSQCMQLFAMTHSDLLVCPQAPFRVDFRGALVTRHRPDTQWDLERWVGCLHSREQLSWREVYWMIWGQLICLTCDVCGEGFAVSRYKCCAYHPSSPHFMFGQNDGIYPCCHTPAVRFSLTRAPHSDGCCSRNHTVSGDGGVLGVLLEKVLRYQDVICMPFADRQKAVPSMAEIARAEKLTSDIGTTSTADSDEDEDDKTDGSQADTTATPTSTSTSPTAPAPPSISIIRPFPPPSSFTRPPPYVIASASASASSRRVDLDRMTSFNMGTHLPLQQRGDMPDWERMRQQIEAESRPAVGGAGGDGRERDRGAAGTPTGGRFRTKKRKKKKAKQFESERDFDASSSVMSGGGSSSSASLAGLSPKRQRELQIDLIKDDDRTRMNLLHAYLQSKVPAKPNTPPPITPTPPPRPRPKTPSPSARPCSGQPKWRSSSFVRDRLGSLRPSPTLKAGGGGGGPQGVLEASRMSGGGGGGRRSASRPASARPRVSGRRASTPLPGK